MSRPARLTDEERSERRRQHRLAYSARKKAAELDGSTPEDRRRHMFADPGEPIFESPWRPRAVRPDPEAIMAAAFNAARCDYGGPIPADTVMRAVLHAADRLIAESSQDVLQGAEARSQGKKIPGRARKRPPSSAQVEAGQEGVC
jgi:hypothetical protein